MVCLEGCDSPCPTWRSKPIGRSSTGWRFGHEASRSPVAVVSTWTDCRHRNALRAVVPGGCPRARVRHDAGVLPKQSARRVAGRSAAADRAVRAGSGHQPRCKPYQGACPRAHRQPDAAQPGVLELLSLLRRLELPRAIATHSSRATVERHLEAHNLAGRFHHIVAHGDYERHKPDPEPYLKTAEGLAVLPSLCLALEDSHHGVRSASSAGMMTIMVPDLLPATTSFARFACTSCPTCTTSIG